MTPTEQDLARQLAAHPEWAWMDGMLATGHPLHESRQRVASCGALAWLDDGDAPTVSTAPDLSDPATQGCLIAMLGRRCTCIERALGGGWNVYRLGGFSTGKTLGEALARAWLAVVNRD